MTKPEFISSVVEAEKAKGHQVTKTQVESILNSGLESIRDAVKTEGKVQLIGFGTFSKTHKEERTGWNPALKKNTVLPAKDSVKFKGATSFFD